MPPLTRLFRREVAPFGRRAGVRTVDGHEIIDNPDPTLNYLAMNDESEYRKLDVRPTIAIAWQRRTSNLLKARSELEKPQSPKPAAKLIHSWTVAMLKNVRGWPEVQKQAMNGIRYGWQPMEMVWQPFSWRSEEWWGPRTIREKCCEQYRWTTDRSLVYRPYSEPQEVFRAGQLEKWLVPTYGSLDNPYGKGIYRVVWLHDYVAMRFLELMSQGGERAIGLPMLERDTTDTPGAAGKPDQDDEEAMGRLQSEIQEMLNLLHSDNVLVSLDGWKLSLKTDSNFVDGWRGLLDYFNHEITAMVAGTVVDTRTSEDRGSRALFQVYRSGGNDVTKSDAMFLETAINEQMIEPLIRRNHPDVDPEDIPRWRSLVHYETDPKVLQTFYKMGYPIDGRRAGQVHGVPLGDEEDEDAIVLLKGSGEPVDEAAEEDGETPDPDDGDDREAPESEDAEKRQTGPSRQRSIAAMSWDHAELM